MYRARSEEGSYQLYIRRLDQPTPSPLAGTQSARSAYAPVFSPNGQWIAYYDGGVLKKISIRGGPPTTLCETPILEGVTWTTDGYIVYCLQGNRDVLRVGENGGEPEVVVGHNEGESPYYPHAPLVLPDASAVLFSASAGAAATNESSIKAYSFATGRTTDLVSNATFPLYSQSGHLLFVRESTLMAAPFDARRLKLTGDPVPFVKPVGQSLWYDDAHVRITRAGTLFFLSGGQRTLVTLNRKGVPTQLTKRTGRFYNPSLSPDETQIAVAVQDEAGGNASIWLLDTEKDQLSLLTPEPRQACVPVRTGPGVLRCWLCFV